MPRRVQLSRARGWRMPEGAVKVDRSTRWGNPFVAATPAERARAVAQYRAWLPSQPALVAAARDALRGRDLACWCPLDGPCHADVLLDVANGAPP